jgi:uncharacterized membrane protein
MSRPARAYFDPDGFNRRQRSSSGTRLGTAALIGIPVGCLIGAVGEWMFLPLVAWVVTAVVFLTWTWTAVWPLGPDDTERLSSREDSSRALSDAILVFVSVAALLAVALVVFTAGQSAGSGGPATLMLGVASVICAWAVLHTVFTLKYARQYYRDAVGGLGFNQDEPPGYRDFAYVAFTVGMTFQVSDTDIQHARMRSLVLGHALMAYLFGAVIIAVTVNLLAGLSGGSS